MLHPFMHLDSWSRVVAVFAVLVGALAALGGCQAVDSGPVARPELPTWSHEHVAWTRPISGGDGVLFEGVIEPESPFTEAILSFNAEVPESSGLAAQVRVEREGRWSPWATLSTWGAIIPAAHTKIGFPAGRVAIDELLLDTPADRAEVRVLARGAVTLDRLDLILTGRSMATGLPAPSTGERLELAVPFRPNKAEDEALRSRLCSPTSLRMLLAWQGVEPGHETVCQRAYSAEFDLYGVWPRNIQAARSFGVGARLARFSSWEEVREHLETDGPIAISITAERGELRNAGYDLTAGHLIVLTGLTESGDALVLDPAFGERAEARRVYLAEDLTRVWLQRKRGTSYSLTGQSYALLGERP
ncbi:MAG: C39 family peptidase [Planctomycetota bacterium]